MRVGWLADKPGYLGGAELTQAEFRAAAPDDVEVVDCPPGGVVEGLDRYVIHNCIRYSTEDLPDAPLVCYVNDLWQFGSSRLHEALCARARMIFTSPLHLKRFPHSTLGPKNLIPPALDLDRYRAQSNGHREGSVCIGRMAYGKGLDLLATHSEPVDVYSSVMIRSQGTLTYRGSLKPEQVAETLSHYRRFVFLPTAIEPFGRAVVEAWAAGCDLIVNRRVGALHWITHDQRALETAASDFWEVVRG